MGMVRSARLGTRWTPGECASRAAGLAAAYVALGVPLDQVTFGHVVADECARLGIGLGDYLAAYDVAASRPFPGVEALVSTLERWAVCSNKARASCIQRQGMAPTTSIPAGATVSRSIRP